MNLLSIQNATLRWSKLVFHGSSAFFLYSARNIIRKILVWKTPLTSWLNNGTVYAYWLLHNFLGRMRNKKGKNELLRVGTTNYNRLSSALPLIFRVLDNIVVVLRGRVKKSTNKNNNLDGRGLRVCTRSNYS